MKIEKCRIDSHIHLTEPIKNETFTFKRNIPVNIKSDIQKAVRRTSKTGNEQSLTWCRVKNTRKIFTAGKASGSQGATETVPCHVKHGDTEQIGDLHTHPTYDDRTIGLTPSTADYVSTVTDSAQKGIPQISCITGPYTKFINCYQPKPHVIHDPQIIDNYKDALRYTESSVTDISPYLKENVRAHFDHALYDRKTLKRVYKPTPKDIVKDSLMKSKENLKRDVPEHLKPDFCGSVEALNYPTPNNAVKMECLRQLK